MKKLIVIILVLFSGAAMAQTTGQFRYDTTKFLKIGGRNHVMIENLIQVTDSTYKALVIGADGVIKKITYWPGAGGGGSGTLQQVTDNGAVTTNGIQFDGDDAVSFPGLGVRVGSAFDNMLRITNTDANTLDLNTSLLTDPRTQAFPDKDGTFAMLSDIGITSDSLRKHIPRAGTASDGGGNVTGNIDITGEVFIQAVDPLDGAYGGVILNSNTGTIALQKGYSISGNDYTQIVALSGKQGGNDTTNILVSDNNPLSRGLFGSQYFLNKTPLTYAQIHDIDLTADSIRGEIADSVAGTIQSVVAGTNVTVDNTDPRNPVVSASGGGDKVPYTGATQDVSLGTKSISGKNSTFFSSRIKIGGVAGFQYSFGNSITVGQGAATPSTDGYAPLLSATYSLPLTNYGLSGSGIWKSSQLHNLNINPGHAVFTTVMAGFNDVRRGGSIRTTLNKVIWGLNAIIANQFLKSWVTAGAGSGVTRHGASWATTFNATSVGGKNHSNGAFTNAVNDSIVYTFVDSTVVVGLITADGITNQYSDFTVYIDNVSVGSFTENFQTDGISDGVYDNKRTPMALIFKGLTNATHKIKLVNNSASTSKYLVVDYFGHLVDREYALPLMVFHAPKMNSTGYATSPALANDAVIDTLNSKIDSLISNYTNYPIYTAVTNNYYDINTGLGVDNIHPNNTGYIQIKNAGIAALPEVTAAATPLQGAVVIGKQNTARPFISFYNPSASTDYKIWDSYSDDTAVHFRAINDVNSNANTWLRVVRTGFVPTYIKFPTGNVGVGTGANPTSALTTTSFATAYTATATSLGLSASHNVVNVTATGQTITLPTAVGITGREYKIKLTASGTGTVATTSSQTIDGVTTYTLSAQYKFVHVVSDGANWIIIGSN